MPFDNSIMVIDKGPLPVGHVGIVTKAIYMEDGTYTLKVQESNWDSDEFVDCDVTYTFYPETSELKRESGDTLYFVLGFIYGRVPGKGTCDSEFTKF